MMVLLLIANTVVLTVWAFVNDYTGFFTERSAWEYCNPLLIVETVLIFMWFQNITFKSDMVKNFINGTAKYVFGIYLLHSSLLKFIPFEKLIFRNGILFWSQMFTVSTVIFAFCYIISAIYATAMYPVYKMLNKFMSKYEWDVKSMLNR